MASSNSPKLEEEDEELNALLDSALNDFSKVDNSKVAATSQNSVDVTLNNAPKTDKQEEKKGDKVEDFLGGISGMQNFEEAMRSFLEEDPNFKEQMQKLAEAANASGSSKEEEDAFATSLAETLKGIAENAQSLSENPSEEELSKILGNLGVGGQEGDSAVPNIIPLMQNVMQSLLSKDLLYPALKEIVDKYPEWLAENRGSLEQNVYENYNKQYGLMKQVCDEFDAEETDDTEQKKKARFDRILQLMQKMQDCGHPPKEILGELSPDVELDERGNMKLPGLPSGEQCSIM